MKTSVWLYSAILDEHEWVLTFDKRAMDVTTYLWLNVRWGIGWPISAEQRHMTTWINTDSGNGLLPGGYLNQCWLIIKGALGFHMRTISQEVLMNLIRDMYSAIAVINTSSRGRGTRCIWIFESYRIVMDFLPRFPKSLVWFRFCRQAPTGFLREEAAICRRRIPLGIQYSIAILAQGVHMRSWYPKIC